MKIKQMNARFFLLKTAATILGASAALAAATGCRSSDPQRAVIIDNNPSGVDPAGANLAPVDTPAAAPVVRPTNVRVLGQQQAYTPQQSVEEYPQQAPSPQVAEGSQPAYEPGVDAGYQALEDASAPPPPLPVYDQPPAPEPNDLWTPGYWNYAPQGYYWVPGAWVAAPYAGALWTPGYWGYESNRYRFHRGFWARHIGFYGGINYGFGYTGLGYSGGYWNGNNFYYNRAVNRVNVTNIHNVYERTVVVNNVTRVSYNGGNGGLQARPEARELAVLREQRTPAMSTQVQLRQEAAQNRQQFFNQNHGQPAQPFASHPIAAQPGVSAAPAQQVQQRPTDQRQQQLEQQRTSREQQQNVRPQGFGPQQEQQRVLQQQQEQQRNVQAHQEQQRAQANQQQQRALQQQEQQRNAQTQQQQREQQQQRVQTEQQQRPLQQQQLQPEQQQRSVQGQPHPQLPASRPEPMQRPASPPPQQHLPAQPPASRPEPPAQPQHTQLQPQAQHVQAQPQQQRSPEAHPAPAPHPNQK